MFKYATISTIRIVLIAFKSTTCLAYYHMTRRKISTMIPMP